MDAVRDSNIAKAARTPYFALAGMLFYISTSGICRGKIFRLMVTGATAQPHHNSTAGASRPWSIEFFPVRSRVVAGDWPVGPVAWGWKGAVLQRQINLRPAVAPLFTNATNRERWKPCTQDKIDFIATLRQCSLPNIRPSVLSRMTLRQLDWLTSWEDFEHASIIRVSVYSTRPWLCWVISRCSESFFVMLSARNPSSIPFQDSTATPLSPAEKQGQSAVIYWQLITPNSNHIPVGSEGQRKNAIKSYITLRTLKMGFHFLISSREG